MKISTAIVASLSLTLLGIFAASSFVSATSPAKSIVAKTASVQSEMKEVSEGSKEINDDAKDQQESTQLQALAKITPQQAQQAAIASQPGPVASLQLENEDGNLLYAVTIGQKEVKVDAGNGKVLYIDDTKSENDGKNRLRSSIQVPEPPGGDGDGETKDDQR